MVIYSNLARPYLYMYDLNLYRLPALFPGPQFRFILNVHLLIKADFIEKLAGYCRFLFSP